MSYRLTTLASTGSDFVDFAPYVAAINERGVVAFQATLHDNASGVFESDGACPRVTIDTRSGPLAAIQSHPDINQAGELCFYASNKSGGSGLYLVRDGECICVASPSEELAGVGPLGPTMSDSGAIAFRADDPAGRAGIYRWERGEICRVALAGDSFSGFEGLPVVGSGGAVAFRANLPGGSSAIYLHAGDRLSCVADTASDFAQLGRFVDLNSTGQVAFVATRRDGSSGVFVNLDGKTESLVESEEGFESFRGALVPKRERLVFYGRPAGAQLGIYARCGGRHHRVLGIGDAMADSIVTSFALNPVSINEAGQLAIRVALKSGRGLILRADSVD